MFFVGIDVGTQGTRVMLVGADGTLVYSVEESLPVQLGQHQSHRYFEQDPERWDQTVRQCLRRVGQYLRENSYSAEDVVAISATSTSGTIVPIDVGSGRPLHAAIMYNDARAQEEADVCNEYLQDITLKLGYLFNASYGLPKMLWLFRNIPECRTNRCRWLHATDFILGSLMGEFHYTDQTNALKSGYDILDNRWPTKQLTAIGIDSASLPEVVPSGTVIGHLHQAVADDTGLSVRTKVVAGMTDGCASQVAAGAIRVGEWNTTIGTTLVIKGVSDALVVDPYHRIYSHRHPMGYWMPGGASNTGGEALALDFPNSNLQQLDLSVKHYSPSKLIKYPLKRIGERFPIVAPQARGFQIGTETGHSLEQQYAATLEGIAYIERLSYDYLQKGLGMRIGQSGIFTSGGGARSQAWLQLRANIINQTIRKPAVADGAMGAAIVAASQTMYQDIIQAGDHMTTMALIVYPEPTLVDQYESQYRRFVEEFIKRGYLREEETWLLSI